MAYFLGKKTTKFSKWERERYFQDDMFVLYSWFVYIFIYLKARFEKKGWLFKSFSLFIFSASVIVYLLITQLASFESFRALFLVSWFLKLKVIFEVFFSWIKGRKQSKIKKQNKIKWTLLLNIENCLLNTQCWKI